MKATKEGSKEPLEVRIKIVRNGVHVCGYIDDCSTEYEYVYKDLPSALKEIGSIFDVLKEELPEQTMEDMKEEEKKINKGEY